MRAMRARDKSALRGVLADNVVAVDHRSGIFLEGNSRDDFIGSVTVLWDLVTELEVIPESIEAVGGRGIVTRGQFSGRFSGGGTFDQSAIQVLGISDGQITSADWYDADGIEAALARFAELEAPAHDVAANLAARATLRLFAAVQDGDLQVFEACLHPEVAWDDRRPLFRMIGGAREILTAATFRMTRPGLRAESEMIATYGDRVALERRRLVDESTETDALCVSEVDDEGLIVALVLFDVGAVREAIDEAWNRYRAGEGAPFGSILEVAVAFVGGVRQRDIEVVPRRSPRIS